MPGSRENKVKLIKSLARSYQIGMANTLDLSTLPAVCSSSLPPASFRSLSAMGTGTAQTCLLPVELGWLPAHGNDTYLPPCVSRIGHPCRDGERQVAVILPSSVVCQQDVSWLPGSCLPCPDRGLVSLRHLPGFTVSLALHM